MPRSLRFINPRDLVEVTCRTAQAQYLLTPSPEVNDIILGVMAVAQERFGIDIVDVCVLSGHYHMLLIVDSAKQLADFMECFQGNVARRVNKYLGRTGPFWHSRYHAIVISTEVEAQVGRLHYLLENSCKENLVSSPLDWPGVHSAKARVRGDFLQGTWPSLGQVEPPPRVKLSPLPAWAHLSRAEYQRQITALVREIEKATTARHTAAGTRPMGAKAIVRQNPFRRPEEPKKTPQPRFHTFRREVAQQMEGAYRSFVAAYRAAAQKLRDSQSGIWVARFPLGCFPPALPFVETEPEMA